MITPFSNVQEQIDHFFSDTPHPYRVLDQKLAAEVKPDSTVLEIGCGRNAPCLRRLRGRAARLYGIDLVEFSVKFDDLILLNESVTDMRSIAENTIDLAFSRSVMEHVENPPGAYREIFRILKPGGKYIFLTPNRYDYASIAASLVPNRFHSKIVRHTEGRKEIDTFPTFYRSNSFSRIRKLSDDSGFEVLELARLGQYPSYLQFNRVLFWLGCLYEKALDRSKALDCLKGWIICVLKKPSPS